MSKLMIQLVNKFTDLDSKFTNLDNSVSRLEKNIKKNLKIIKKEVLLLSGAKAKNISKKSSCFLELIDKNQKLFHGSGTVVDLYGVKYVATNRHIVYSNGTFLKIQGIFNNGAQLLLEGDEIIVSDDANVDLALIPIKAEDHLQLVAADVSAVSPKEAGKIYGTNYYQGKHTYCECTILNVKTYSTGVYPILVSNCLGKDHYSGTGYFNSHRLLTAVHKSESDFIDDSSQSENDELPEDYKQKVEKYIIEKCNITKYTADQLIPCKLTYQNEQIIKCIYRYNNKSFENNNSFLSIKALRNMMINDKFFEKQFALKKIIFKDYDHHMRIRARNPYSNLIDASHLHGMALRHQNRPKRK